MCTSPLFLIKLMEYFRKITWLVISNTNLVFSFFLSMNHWQPIVTSNGYVRGILLLLPEGGCHIVTKRNDLSNVQLLLFMRLNWTKLGQITALVQVKLRERSQRKKGWDIPSNCSKKRTQLARPSDHLLKWLIMKSYMRRRKKKQNKQRLVQAIMNRVFI